jgi:conjugative relaxase-like TrwC/TraI family protein
VVTVGRVQTTHKIAGGDADGFARYLTSTSARGDYYAGHDEESDGDPGGVVPQSRWHGSPAMLAALALSPERPVGRDDLTALMRGVSPATGEELRPAGGNGTRVAGIDMTFSAPKSVSALWAVGSPYERARIEAAHVAAVASALGRTERDVELVRTRTGGELRWQRAQRLVAAEFVHTSSRLTREQETGGVPDPQLHSHVVVLGAERTDGRFAAVDSRELFRAARAGGAWYRAELACNLERLGLEIEGGTGRDGRYFEVKGVPGALSERWSARSQDIDRAAREFRTRYGRDPRAGELGSITVGTRGTKTTARAADVDEAWSAVGEEHGLSHGQAQSLYGERERTAEPARDFAERLLADVSRDRSMVAERDLYARAYEISPGNCEPREARRMVEELARAGELVALEGGMWTTRELRERETRTMDLAAARAGEHAAPVGEETLVKARAEVEREIAGRLSREQRHALETITGEGGMTVLEGQAGTGKGVVLAAASQAWREEGYTVIGTAVAGATAERLGADARLERSVTTDGLVNGVERGRERLDKRTVVVMDEAGIADTRRLSRLAEIAAERDAKLVLVGDGAQLSPIGAGGLFARIGEEVPSARLTEVHRARHEWERQAWAQVRDGNSAHALASYEARGRLHIEETREQAARRMATDWNRTRFERPDGRTVMLTDASNKELDRLNAMAQEHRAANGELGHERVALPDRPYGVAAGDRIIFTAALNPPGQDRVHNGTQGTVLDAKGDGALKIQTHGAKEREVEVDAKEFHDLRLAYAQHVYKAQGLTTDRALVLTGGWQTDRERSYVALSRARERTDIYVSRQDLGEQGMDSGAIERLGEAMARSNAQDASITRAEVERAGRAESSADRERERAEAFRTERDEERESEAGRIMRESREQWERERDLGIDNGIE